MGSRVLSIVVTYNAVRHNWLQKCLESLEQSSLANDIVVIDNASTDATREIIKKQYPNVELVCSEVNLGFGKANNIGLERAVKENYEFVFLLNQDATVEKDSILNLVNAAVNHPEYGLISPLQFEGNGKSLDWVFSNQIIPKYCKNLYSDSLSTTELAEVYPCDFVSAASWLITRKCFYEVGGLNPTFFHYGEDNNYVQRVLYKGFKIGVSPKSKMFHDRQRAPDWNFNSKEYTSLRDYLINLSNPDRKFDTKNGIRHLKIKLLKSYLKRDKEEINQIKSELKYLKEKEINIEQNFKTSISDTCAFLNI